MFLYRTGRSFEEHLADRLFGKILADQPPNWHERPCDLVLGLIETFNWFGKLLSDDGIPLVPGTSGESMRPHTRAGPTTSDVWVRPHPATWLANNR